MDNFPRPKPHPLEQLCDGLVEWRPVEISSGNERTRNLKTLGHQTAHLQPFRSWHGFQAGSTSLLPFQPGFYRVTGPNDIFGLISTAGLPKANREPCESIYKPNETLASEHSDLACGDDFFLLSPP
jgi:hypothetical protein